MYIVSAFIGKSGYKKETSQTTDANNPGATPNSENASVSSNNTVPQSEQTVNNNIPENSAENSPDAQNNDSHSEDSAPTGGRVLDMPAITVEQQNFVKKIGKALGRNVEFVNMDKFLKQHDIDTKKLKIYPDGAIDGEGNIYIWYNTKKAVQFLFKHELTHFGERSKLYKKFVKAIRKTNAYKDWLESAVKETESWKAWRRTRPENPHLDIDGMEKFLREERMSAREGLKEVGPGEAQTEIIADFVGEKCFGENLEDLKKIVKGIENVKERNVVAQFFYDFFSNIRKKIEGISKIDREIGRIEDLFARMIKDANNTKTPDTNGRGLKYSASDESVIDLSNDNELAKKIGDLHGADKYKAIQSYILDVLSEQPIVLSDGKNAVVDRSDALHIANKSGNEKTAQIAQIKQLVENAILYAEDNNVEHNKFNYFCYYKAKVKYGEETFELFLNVGRAKNDGEYHIYDITKKVRDTAHRINGVERPKPNEGYALENDVSMNNIPKPNQNVNNNSQKDELKFSISTESDTATDFTALRKELLDKYKNGEITEQEFSDQMDALWDRAISENGQIKPGENVAPQNKPFAVPRSVKDGTKVRRHVSRILQKGCATPEQENVFKEMILDDKFSYTPTSNTPQRRLCC